MCSTIVTYNRQALLPPDLSKPPSWKYSFQYAFRISIRWRREKIKSPNEKTNVHSSGSAFIKIGIDDKKHLFIKSHKNNHRFLLLPPLLAWDNIFSEMECVLRWYFLFGFYWNLICLWGNWMDLLIYTLRLWDTSFLNGR